MSGSQIGHISPLIKPFSGVQVESGSGAYLYSSSGDRYLDFTSGIGVTSTGHCHPKVVDAVRDQAGRLIHGQYTTVRHPLLQELSNALASRLPDPIDTFFYVSAGAEAVEAAVRLARHATGRANVIAFSGGFHGRTTGALSLTSSKSAISAGVQPLMAGVVISPFPYAYRYGWDVKETADFCLDELRFVLETQSAPGETAAMIIEPVLGEGGYVPIPEGFLEGLREICDEHGILLILDEIQTGIGRTGKFWGFEHGTARPDIVITAKGLASGLPLSAIGASMELMSKAWPGSQGGTYGGNVVACAAALATLGVIEEEGLVENARLRGEALIGGLRDLGSRTPGVGDVRGIGLMAAVEFSKPNGKPDPELALQVLRYSVEQGLLLLPCGTSGNVVRFIPPLIVDDSQVAEGLEMFSHAVERLN